MKRMAARVMMLLVLLAGGAIVNVAVAWGCAIWSYMPPIEDVICKRVEETPAEFKQLVEPNWLDPIEYADLEDFSIMLLDRQRHATGWSCRRFEIWWLMIGDSYAVPSYSAYLVRAGWPMQSLSCAGTSQVGLRSTGKWWKWNAAIEPPQWLRAREMGIMGDELFPRPMPLRPLWPGFAVNTAFYAAVLCGCWMLLIAPGRLRRRRRIKRGLCPKCAYPVGESTVCTECGTAVKHFRPLNRQSGL